MKRLLYLVIILALPVAAQRHEQLRGVSVTATRPLRDIGVNRTTFDSLALKENIALSMADILAYNSSVFVKNHGRATLSTVAFRGTGAGHTQVLWNGVKINSPMLGTTDFSTIPSYFIDRASLLHGSSGVNETGGGLGGIVRLATAPDTVSGLHAHYVQGVGSFSTFDQFARLSWHRGNWTIGTRAVYSTSKNDYSYINHDKKENIYDSDHNIVSQYHPREQNRSGAFKDLHVMQEIYRSADDTRTGLNVWYTNSWRQLPLTTVDYGADLGFDNSRRETNLRAVVSYDRKLRRPSNAVYLGNTALKAGYVNTHNAYDYSRETVPGLWNQLIRARSQVHTAFGTAALSLNPSTKWLVNADLSAYQHFVKSEDKTLAQQSSDRRTVIGYDRARLEMSGAVSLRWQPVAPLGLAAVMRGEIAGNNASPLIPALFADYRHIYNIAGVRVPVTVKASASRNYRFPSLNDLYFMPGGNPDLRSERGYTADLNVTFDANIHNTAISAGAGAFASRIDDWIIWLPTTKGFFSPRNVQRVHASGIETSAQITLPTVRGWQLGLNSSYSYTPSVNRSNPLSDADKSVGRQLPYVPVHTGALTARLTYRRWALLYKWNAYSRRYTMTSNDYTLSGYLPAYFMSNVSVDKTLPLPRGMRMDLKLAVNNLFNEDYLSILSRPMPGINFELFAGISF